MTSTTRPDLRKYVGLCMTCRHWQIDIRPAAITELGGFMEAMNAIAEAHSNHLPECPGGGGRIKFEGKWIDPPILPSGNPADGSLELTQLPTWWVPK